MGERSEITIHHRSDPYAVAASASIWARAKALRDGAQDESAWERASSGIERRLQLTGSRLLLARRGGAAVGFAVLAPHRSKVELYFLAVDPGAWGSGVAGQLLRRVVAEARGVGATTVELWVIDDNHRAIGVDERSGWVRTERLQHDSATSRVERLLVNHLD